MSQNNAEKTKYIIIVGYCLQKTVQDRCWSLASLFVPGYYGVTSALSTVTQRATTGKYHPPEMMFATSTAPSLTEILF